MPTAQQDGKPWNDGASPVSTIPGTQHARCRYQRSGVPPCPLSLRASPARRVLAPGGLLIWETPISTISSTSHYFHLDPTYRESAEMMAVVTVARGFSAPEITQMHPIRGCLRGTNHQLAAALDTLFDGTQGYALVAR